MSSDPVAILRALFCTVCRSVHLDGRMAGVHMGAAYSRILRHIDLYDIIIISLFCPQLDPARDFRILSFLLAFSAANFACLLKMCIAIESNVTPSGLGCFSRGTN